MGRRGVNSQRSSTECYAPCQMIGSFLEAKHAGCESVPIKSQVENETHRIGCIDCSVEVSRRLKPRYYFLVEGVIGFACFPQCTFRVHQTSNRSDSLRDGSPVRFARSMETGSFVFCKGMLARHDVFGGSLISWERKEPRNLKVSNELHISKGR